MSQVLPFILCGGAGTRLWPLSREAFPKQFHRIGSAETLVEQTVRKFGGEMFGPPSILSTHRHRFLVAEQLESMGIEAGRIVLEPSGWNTAPACCVAALA